MAEASSVPYNFGVEYFDSDHYSNIEIILKDGSRVKANTVILAKNSTFFKELIENKSPKVIEMDEYDAIVCKSFLKSLYSGDPGILDKSNFRQVSKLSFTCEVTWMQNKCIEHFRKMMHNRQNADSQFLMEEAVAAKEFDKGSQYLNILAQHKTENVCIEDIESMEAMLQDFGTLSLDKLDFFIRLANVCKRNWHQNRNYSYGYPHRIPATDNQKEYCTVLMEKVTTHLKNLGKIDVKARYVLTNLDFKGIAAKFIQNYRHPHEEYYYQEEDQEPCYLTLQSYQNTHQNQRADGTDAFKKAASIFFQGLLDLQVVSNDDLRLALKQHMSLGN